MIKKVALYAIIAAATILTSCTGTKSENAQFTIEGTIANAENKVLYLDKLENGTATTIDSVSLDAQGHYHFNHATPAEATFYRLRLDKQYVNFVVDSATTLTCSGNSSNLASAYDIAGCDDCSIMRDVAIWGNRLRKAINENTATALDSLEAYKTAMTQYALQAPASPVAYYIILQQIEGLPIFDTYDTQDNKVIAAVATAHEAYYPNLARTAYLKNLALQGIAFQRQNRPIEVDEEQVKEINFVDIELYDTEGNLRKLSDITADNKVVLLDFSSYAAEYSPYYNFDLKELYEKYHGRGFEIYQVGFDNEIAAWRSAAANLPWITVREPNITGSTLFTHYNIQILPTCFIIIDNGAQFIRPGEMEEIKKIVKQKLG